MQRLPSALSRAAYVAGAPAPCVRLSAHDISPRLEVQLVLELKSRKPRAEVIQILPGSSRWWLALPFDEQLAHAPGDPGLGDLGWCRNSSPVP